MTLRHLAAFGLAAVVLLGGLLVASRTAMPPVVAQADLAEPPSLDRSLAEQVRRGEDLYAANCAVCHGATGLGYAEAKTAFPPDHQRCTRCHKPGNPAEQSLDEPFDDHDMFDLGSPPAVVGEDALHAFPNALAVHAYVAATMPRYEPGRLTAEEYLKVTAWLLAANDRLDGDEPLRLDELAQRGTVR